MGLNGIITLAEVFLTGADTCCDLIEAALRRDQRIRILKGEITTLTRVDPTQVVDFSQLKRQVGILARLRQLADKN